MQSNQNLLNLGRALKERREELGLTLQESADKTKISVHTLQDIESARADRLPVYAYLRGFILAYARVLEMDEKKMEQEVRTLAPLEDNTALSKVAPFSSETENLIEKDLRLTPVILAVSILFVLGGILVFGNMIGSYKEKSVGEMSGADVYMEKDQGEQEPGEQEPGEQDQGEKSPALEQKNREEKNREQDNREEKNREQDSREEKNREQNSWSQKNKGITLPGGVAIRASSPAGGAGRASAPAYAGAGEKQKISLELIVKALGEVKVEYQVDRGQKKAVHLKKNQFEVLKGLENIFIQTKDSDLIYIFRNGKNLGLFGSGGRKEQTFTATD